MTRIDEQLDAPGDPERTAGVLGIIADRRPNEQLRVLDLACRTGAFAWAAAEAGHHAYGLEGRAENLALAAGRPENGAQYMQGDVRDLSPERHGMFDVVLCLGILYHLAAGDAIALLRAIRAVTVPGGFAIIDTHVGDSSGSAEVDGAGYRGFWYGEPPDGWWSSIGNSRSFWFSPESLDDAIRAAGWEQIEHHLGIRWAGEPAGRQWLVIS